MTSTRSIALIALFTISWTGSTPAASLYQVTEFGPISTVTTPQRQEINNAGQVTSTESNNSYLYSGGTTTQIGPSNGAVVAMSINSSGQVVGTFKNSGGLPNAFLYSGGTFTNLAVETRGLYSHANGINDAGQIVGDSTFGVFDQTAAHAFWDDHGVVTDLTALTGGLLTSALAINSSGQIVGTDSAGHAALYSGGVVTDLGTRPGETTSKAIGINDIGQILCTGAEPGGLGFIYDAGAQIDLSFRPFGINNHGQVVGGPGGFSALLYSNGVTVNLLDPTQTGLANLWVNSINDNGAIAGATFDTAVGGVNVILTPVPEPAGAVLAVLGLTGLLALGQRRHAVERLPV